VLGFLKNQEPKKMCPFESILTPQRQLILICLISVGVLGCAYILENFFGVHPCPLCLIERYFFVATGVVSFLGFTIVQPSQKHLLFLGLSLLFFMGGCVAAYHTGVQYGLFDAPSFCGAPEMALDISFDDLKTAILATPVVHCNEITWSLLGLSLAVYNAVLSFVLSGYAFFLYGRFHGAR